MAKGLSVGRCPWAGSCISPGSIVLLGWPPKVTTRDVSPLMGKGPIGVPRGVRISHTLGPDPEDKEGGKLPFQIPDKPQICCKILEQRDVTLSL